MCFHTVLRGNFGCFIICCFMLYSYPTPRILEGHIACKNSHRLCFKYKFTEAAPPLTDKNSFLKVGLWGILTSSYSFNSQHFLSLENSILARGVILSDAQIRVKEKCIFTTQNKPKSSNMYCSLSECHCIVFYSCHLFLRLEMGFCFATRCGTKHMLQEFTWASMKFWRWGWKITFPDALIWTSVTSIHLPGVLFDSPIWKHADSCLKIVFHIILFKNLIERSDCATVDLCSW